MLINNQIELDSLCKKLQENRSLAIDTEFVRRSTYYPKIGIIQICTENGEMYILDALNTDISAFNDLLQNEKILKILHSPAQDFEIFYLHFKSLPVNIFDTQTAAKFCGFRSASSYSELCKAICDIDIDKTHQQSDWLQRPLTDLMLEYAKTDVQHLHAIYYKLSQEIKDYSEYENEIKKLLNPSNYKPDYENAWKKVKSRINLNNKKLNNRIRHIAAFREEMASILDIPRAHFISDESIVYLCKTLPTRHSELKFLKAKTNWINHPKYQEKLLNLCQSLKE